MWWDLKLTPIIHGLNNQINRLTLLQGYTTEGEMEKHFVKVQLCMTENVLTY